jgi:hypothetical protein
MKTKLFDTLVVVRLKQQSLPGHIDFAPPALQHVSRMIPKILLRALLPAHGAAHGRRKIFHPQSLFDAAFGVRYQAVYDNHLYHDVTPVGRVDHAWCGGSPPRRKLRQQLAPRGWMPIGSIAGVICLAALFLPAEAALGQDAKPPLHDYPTDARADYVIGCLAANGFQRQLLARCACGIDVIADRLSYEDYETAETILSMQQASVGPRGGLFRDTPIAKSTLELLRRAQAEANLRCGAQ